MPICISIMEERLPMLRRQNLMSGDGVGYALATMDPHSDTIDLRLAERLANRC